MIDRRKIGNKGEGDAVNFLFANGYEVLHRNYRFSRSEVDIIARKDNTIVFVEVKTRKNANYGHPETFISEAQQERIQLAAEEFLRENNWHGNIRFDVIAILLEQDKPLLEHFEDAF